MFSPITAAQNIKDGFIDYITTSFHFADAAYKEGFERALAEEGAVARGPYLDIGGSYETGKSLDELIDEGEASPLFRTLEQVRNACCLMACWPSARRNSAAYMENRCT